MFKLPDLPYDFDALEPHIDAKTMEIHHDKHHATYVKKLNEAVENHPNLQNKEVNELIKDLDSIPKEIKNAIINHGGGHSNHSFWWPMLKKDIISSFIIIFGSSANVPIVVVIIVSLFLLQKGIFSLLG